MTHLEEEEEVKYYVELVIGGNDTTAVRKQKENPNF